MVQLAKSMSSFFRLRNETNSSCPDLTGKNYRASFHTRSSAKGVRKKIYRAHLEGDGPRKGEHAVVKVFRHAKGTESMCDEEIFKHIIARRLSRKFNKLVNDTSDKVSSAMSVCRKLFLLVDQLVMGMCFAWVGVSP